MFSSCLGIVCHGLAGIVNLLRLRHSSNNEYYKPILFFVFLSVVDMIGAKRIQNAESLFYSPSGKF